MPPEVPPEILPLTADLRARLWAWAARFDATLNPDNPVTSEFPSPADQAAFVQDGQALADALQVELGPTIQIQYRPPT